MNPVLMGILAWLGFDALLLLGLYLGSPLRPRKDKS